MQSEVEPGSRTASGNQREKLTLLSIGNEEDLLAYRSKILHLAGFEVITAQPQPDAENQFAILCRLHEPAMAIACHTLTAKQRLALAQQLREACPSMPLMALTNGAFADGELEMYDILLDSLDGPEELIRQVCSRL
jgi:hypothetical protein